VTWFVADTGNAEYSSHDDELRKSGITIVRVNLDKADPPAEVSTASAKVQAAEQYA